MKSEKCPFCSKKYVERQALYDHIEKAHPAHVSEEMSAARVFFNHRNNKTHGTCVICGGETDWNEATERYERFDREGCRNLYREEFSKRMIDKYGKTHLLDDPDQQKKMLENRSISGVYRWSDGGETKYTGSYEHDFLRFLDTMLGFKSSDVMAPAPQVFYYMDGGKKRFYIPDFYIPSINALVEIKDGGDNPNKHHNRQDIDGRKEKIKDEVMKKQKQYNFVKVADKNYSTFLKFLMNIKNEYVDMQKRENFPIVMIEENFNFIENALMEMHASGVPSVDVLKSDKVNAADYSKDNEWSFEQDLSDPTLSNQWIGAYVDNLSDNDKVDLVLKMKATRLADQIKVEDADLLEDYSEISMRDLAKDWVAGLHQFISENAEEMPQVDENNIDRQDVKILSLPEIHAILDAAPKIWLGSDWHLWSIATDDLKAQAAIENQIKMVGPNDVFIYLGDWADDDVSGTEKLRLKKVMRSLSGATKIMVYGNNDIFDEDFYRQGGFDYVFEGFSWKNIAFSHYPLRDKKGHEINIHGHLHGGAYYNTEYNNHIDIYTYREGCKPVEIKDVLKKYEEGGYEPKERNHSPKYENRLRRLKERRDPDNLEESAVIINTEVVQKDVWICPHCNKKIGEKSLFCDGSKWFHRECEGEIELPSSTVSEEAKIHEITVIKRKDKKSSWICPKCNKKISGDDHLFRSKDGVFKHACGIMLRLPNEDREKQEEKISEDVKELVIIKRVDGKKSWICPKCNRKISGDHHLFRSKGVFKHACGIELRLPNEEKKEELSEHIEYMYMKSPLVSLSDGEDALFREDFDVDADGTMLISLREKSDFMSKYNTSHRLMKLYKQTGNVEGVKHELCKMWYMYIIIERYYGKGGKESLFLNKEKHQTEALKAKAFILNDFTNGLKWVMEKEPGFNFDAYFKDTPYNKDVIKLDTGKIQGVKKLIQAIAKPIV